MSRPLGVFPATWLSPIIYDRVIREECAAFGIPVCDVLDGRRTRPAVIVKSRAWKRLRDDRYPYNAIARASGYDHSSIVSAVNRLPALEAWLVAKQAAVIAARKLHDPWREAA